MASIGDQVSEMHRIAKELQLEVVDVISESKSAKAPGRIAFQSMLERIKQGEANGILCWKLNRLARNPIDGGEISWLLQRSIIKSIQCYGKEYRPEDNVLMMAVELGMANQYVNDLSVDVKRGMRKKAERGWYPSRQVPIGYRHNPKKELRSGEDEIITDDERLPLVKQIWQKMAEGQSTIQSMKRYADSIGLRTRSGNHYSYNAITNLLRNEFYAGYFTWTNEAGDRVRIKGKHKTIISQRLYTKVQDIIESRRVKTRIRKYNYPYKTMLQCGACNGSVTAERKRQAICTVCKNKFSCIQVNTCPKCGTAIKNMKNPSFIDRTYYHCMNKKGLCTKASVALNDLEAYLLTELKKVRLPKKFLVWARNELKSQNREVVDETAKRTRTLKKRLTDLQNRLKRYGHMRADEEIEKEEYIKLKADVKNEINALESQLSREAEGLDGWGNRLYAWIENLSLASQKFKNASPEERNRIVAMIGSNLNIKDKTPYLSTPNALEVLEECKVVYESKMKGFEPKKSLTPHTKNTHFEVGVSVLRAKLRDIRTYHDGITNE